MAELEHKNKKSIEKSISEEVMIELEGGKKIRGTLIKMKDPIELFSEGKIVYIPIEGKIKITFLFLLFFYFFSFFKFLSHFLF